MLAARRLECFDSTAWNRYYSIDDDYCGDTTDDDHDDDDDEYGDDFHDAITSSLLLSVS